MTESLLLSEYYIIIEYSCLFNYLSTDYDNVNCFLPSATISFSIDRQRKKRMKETMRRVRFGPELVGRTSGRYASYTFHSRNRSLVTRLLQWMFSQFQDESSVSIGDQSIDRATRDNPIHFARSRISHNSLTYCSHTSCTRSSYHVKSDIM